MENGKSKGQIQRVKAASFRRSGSYSAGGAEGSIGCRRRATGSGRKRHLGVHGSDHSSDSRETQRTQFPPSTILVQKAFRSDNGIEHGRWPGTGTTIQSRVTASPYPHASTDALQLVNSTPTGEDETQYEQN